jgi:hypothetical protein
VNPAGEDACLDGRPVAFGFDDCALADVARQRSNHAAARLVTTRQPHDGDSSAKSCRVVGGVAGAARQDLGRVVLENQDRSFARDTRDASVDELVREQITEDDDASCREAIDELEKPLARDLGRGRHVALEA